jgi:amidohydrolase
MPSPSELARSVCAAIDAEKDAIASASRAIWEHPELKDEERFAMDVLAQAIRRAGIDVARAAHGVPTALRAEVGRASAPKVAILAEYDALPEIGHACGHNLIAAGALGALLGLARLGARLPGRIVLLGTPAEEGGGGKIRLLDAGAFDGVEAAIMFHPADRTLLWHPGLAMGQVEVVFRGRPAHAAGSPWDGASALRGVITLFNLIDSARGQLRDGTRVHGIITDGGQAVNIIPERAAAAFSLRAKTQSQLEELFALVDRCARAAATGSETEVALQRGVAYADMEASLPLARRFGARLQELGIPSEETDPTLSLGSTDMGNVSHALPAIHPFVAVCPRGAAHCHERAFTEVAGSAAALEVTIACAKAMALVALDYLTDESLRDETQRAFASRVG